MTFMFVARPISSMMSSRVWVTAAGFTAESAIRTCTTTALMRATTWMMPSSELFTTARGAGATWTSRAAAARTTRGVKSEIEAFLREAFFVYPSSDSSKNPLWIRILCQARASVCYVVNFDTVKWTGSVLASDY